MRRRAAARTILNPTAGFLSDGFTHTLNPYRGCALANSLCGEFCYAQWNAFHTRGRAWGSFLEIKTGLREAYRRDHDRLRRKGMPLRIYLSSVTEPYPPQERRTRRTRGLLEEMLTRPPDALVIQTHTPLVLDDLDLLRALNQRCRLQVNITVETDLARLPAGFRPHAYPPADRIAALATLRAAGIASVAAVSPLLPLGDPLGFARRLESACDRVILDHYLLGDGSRNGLRTHRTGFPARLVAAGFEHWTKLEALREVEMIFIEIFGGRDRVHLSRTGFNHLV